MIEEHTNGGLLLPYKPAGAAHRKNCSYQQLVELAELGEDDMMQDENRVADEAYETVIRYGTCADRVQATRLYV